MILKIVPMKKKSNSLPVVQYLKEEISKAKITSHIFVDQTEMFSSRMVPDSRVLGGRQPLLQAAHGILRSQSLKKKCHPVCESGHINVLRHARLSTSIRCLGFRLELIVLLFPPLELR